jgi:hypothetical protein
MSTDRITAAALQIVDTDWRQELRDLATFRGLALAHPNAVPLLVTRPLTSPLGQRPGRGEAVLAVRLPVQVSGRSGRVRWTT